MTMLDWDNPLETQTHNKTDVDSALVSNTLSRAASYKEVQTSSEEQNLNQNAEASEIILLGWFLLLLLIHYKA